MVMETPVHPGEILREDVLADLGLSVGEAASRLGISRVTLAPGAARSRTRDPEPRRASGGGRCGHRPSLAGHAVGPLPRRRASGWTTFGAEAHRRLTGRIG
jgi:antitoxin HigA-1